MTATVTSDELRYRIDGLSPGSVERPATVAEVEEVLGSARDDGLAVAPVGGGGALHLGNPLERYDVALDMRGVDRVLDHQPTDLVLSVQAGVTIAEITELLRRHGQWLPVEAPNPERATIGGLIATALSGPGRHVHGSLRDNLIGISVASAAGGVAKAGGMVVKNVSGFDLMRLHHGALGTLGVIVSANFKVLPSPQAEATVVVEAADVAHGLSFIQTSEGHSNRPSVAVLRRSGAGAAEVAIRYSGRQSAVAAAARDVASGLGQSARVVSGDESSAWWRTWVDRLELGEDPDGKDPNVEIRLGVVPGRTGEIAAAVDASTAQNDISVQRLDIWPQLGHVIIRLDGLLGSAASAAIDTLVGIADGLGATWRITRAPAEVKVGRDVWGRPPAGLDIIRRLKQEFDPGRTLNPGRFCGHL